MRYIGAALGDAGLPGLAPRGSATPQPQAGSKGLWLVVTDPAWV